jgi:bifunctional N-acetylglucosamine-1-phosphate-uridyltransferase/glucosamine-1-phosphate-acetyltransferase GlmU-like protein
MKVLVDAAAPLLDPATIGRLLRAGEHGPAVLIGDGADVVPLAVAGEGPALASAEDPRHPATAARVAATGAAELLRVVDRHSLSTAATAVRDRLVQQHERAGVSFILPATSWLDVDVRIGADTVIYPGVVLEGASTVGSECVIGPYTRIIDSAIGRGVELKGWNYVCRAHVRNRAVVEPYARRGGD